jgi:hypothetical protein
MKSSETPPQVILIVYRFVLPVGLLVFLLIVSQNVERPLFLGSQGLDLFARVWILLSFGLLYVRLSDLGRYMFRTYGIQTDHAKNHELPLNWRNILLGSLLGVVSMPFTWWIIQAFLPIFSGMSWLLAGLHGLVLSIPMAIWRNRLVL